MYQENIFITFRKIYNVYFRNGNYNYVTEFYIFNLFTRIVLMVRIYLVVNYKGFESSISAQAVLQIGNVQTFDVRWLVSSGVQLPD